MNEVNELLAKVQFYPCDREYVGCTPQKNNLGDCELPTYDIKTFILGDCGGECDLE